jgi:hypothetical protein
MNKNSAMKKVPRLLTLIFLLCATGISAAAQEEPSPAVQKIPRWVSAKGYWMVEGNINQPRHSYVYFYNNENMLVHKDTIDGVKISVSRRRTKMKLKKALERVVDAWAAGQPPAVSNQIVAALFTN